MSRRNAFSLIELLVVMAILGVLIGILLPAIQKVRESAKRSECESRLRQLGIACHTFHDARRALPTNVNQLFDSRYVPPTALSSAPYPNVSTVFIDLLPYMEEENQVATWSSQPKPIKGLFCPSRRDTSVGARSDFASGFSPHALNRPGPPPGNANFGSVDWERPPYVGVTSEWYNIRSVMGDMYATSGKTLTQINTRDGTSATALLAHKGMAPQHYKGTGPNDGNWSQLNGGANGFWHHNRFPGFMGRDQNGRYTTVAATGLDPFADKLLTSPHAAAAPTLFCDGSVRPIGYTLGIAAAFLWGYNDHHPIDLD